MFLFYFMFFKSKIVGSSYLGVAAGMGHRLPTRRSIIPGYLFCIHLSSNTFMPWYCTNRISWQPCIVSKKRKKRVPSEYEIHYSSRERMKKSYHFQAFQQYLPMQYDRQFKITASCLKLTSLLFLLLSFFFLLSLNHREMSYITVSGFSFSFRTSWTIDVKMFVVWCLRVAWQFQTILRFPAVKRGLILG